MVSSIASSCTLANQLTKALLQPIHFLGQGPGHRGLGGGFGKVGRGLGGHDPAFLVYDVLAADVASGFAVSFAGDGAGITPLFGGGEDAAQAARVSSI
jgi:hypothetical protein